MSRLKMSIICLCAGYGLIWLSGLASPAWAQESRGKEALEEELPGPLLERKPTSWSALTRLTSTSSSQARHLSSVHRCEPRSIVRSSPKNLSLAMAGRSKFWSSRRVAGSSSAGTVGLSLARIAISSQDAKQGSDGRLWVLVQLRSHDFLYSLEDGGWKVKGPPNGHLGGSTVDDGLHFLGTHLVHQFQSEKIQLVGLEGEQWVPGARTRSCTGTQRDRGLL